MAAGRKLTSGLRTAAIVWETRLFGPIGKMRMICEWTLRDGDKGAQGPGLGRIAFGEGLALRRWRWIAPYTPVEVPQPLRETSNRGLCGSRRYRCANLDTLS